MHNYVRRIEQFEDGQTLILWDINEFEVNSYDEMHKLISSYCRIYTNIFTANAYQRLFTQLFEVIENLSEKPVKFYHIDGTGWKCILGDLDPGQAKGLGLALEKRDPSRNWEEHLTYIFKSCLVHFNRNLIAKKFDNEVHLLAKSIPTRSSVEEVHEYCNDRSIT
ncbi:unnamed protein product [Rhizophagus irregularis]|nr:unnamed protein product [Rhizophagus irregularis]